MKNREGQRERDDDRALVEGIDFYFEDGLMVLTRHYLLSRGFCCESGCRHCPYRSKEKSEEKDV